MKKIGLLVAPILSLIFTTQAFAADIGSACPKDNGFGGLCLGAQQLGSVVGSFITFAFVIVGLIALGFLVFGGFKWLTSQGEKQAVEEAQHHIVAAIIGLIIIFLSYLIINVLLGFITNGQASLSHLSLPSLPQASQ